MRVTLTGNLDLFFSRFVSQVRETKDGIVVLFLGEICLDRDIDVV